jgi:hypothetical protein
VLAIRQAVEARDALGNGASEQQPDGIDRFLICACCLISHPLQAHLVTSNRRNGLIRLATSESFISIDLFQIRGNSHFEKSKAPVYNNNNFHNRN